LRFHHLNCPIKVLAERSGCVEIPHWRRNRQDLWFMAETRKLPCALENLAPHQEMLLKMKASNADGTMTKFNEDSACADP
jgi:hypothetical protein